MISFKDKPVMQSDISIYIAIGSFTFALCEWYFSEFDMFVIIMLLIFLLESFKLYMFNHQSKNGKNN